MILSYTAPELALARVYAARRRKFKQDNRALVRDNIVDDERTVENEDMGMLAEMVAARELGLDVNVAVHLEGDPGFDLQLADGRTLDVKWARQPRNGRPHLLYREEELFRADLSLLLMDLPGERMEAIGYCDRETWNVHLDYRDFNCGLGPQSALHARHLAPFRELLGHTAARG